MIYFVLIQIKSHSNLLIYSTGATSPTATPSSAPFSHDFTDDDFFPDLGNLFLDDMGDNLNTNGAAPVAPYVFLSFLFEIVVEFMFLLCILLLC